MIQIKERKEMEDSFKKAQKPWSKHLAKVQRARADYHMACKTERSAANQERNASGDSSLSPDQVIIYIYRLLNLILIIPIFNLISYTLIT